MKKTLIVVCFIGLLFSCKHGNINENTNEIFVNTDNVVDKLDISLLFDNSVDMIPLETTSMFLISDIQKIIFKNELIYISDRINQVIYIFDNSGKYVTSVGQIGGGPNEYSELGDFTITGDSILVQDKFLNKILIYNNKGEHQSNINLLDLAYVEFVHIGHKLYFIVNYEKSELGEYNMITYDLITKEYNTFLSYEENTAHPWGLSKYSDTYKDSVLFILPRDNNIYEIKNENILSKYKMHFSKNNLPLSLLKKGGEEILLEAMDKGYIMGLDQITCSKDYLFLVYSEGTSPREILFDKNTKMNQVCNWFVFDNMGGLYANQYITTDNDEFIVIQDASMFITAWNNIYTNGNFVNNKIKTQMELLSKTVTEDSNPIIFRFKFKNK